MILRIIISYFIIFMMRIECTKGKEKSMNEKKINPSSSTFPVIGIYAQPSRFEGYPSDQYQYVLNAYIDWIQMSGAQAIIIPFDQCEEYYDDILSKINGLLFTGGDLDIQLKSEVDHSNQRDNQWTLNAGYLIEKAIQANDEGDFFPVWGTCQGFQLLQYHFSGYNYTIMREVENDFNVTRSVFLQENRQSSYLFKSIHDNLLYYAENNQPYLYLHHLSVTVEDYEHNPSLNEFFKIVALSANSTHITHRDAFQYIAIIEAHNYPIHGVQFHPEYALFEWAFDSNRSQESLDLNALLSTRFIALARKNSHSFPSIQERDSLLSWNYSTVHIKNGIFSLLTLVDRQQCSKV